MTQAAWLTLALKVALIAGFASLAGWIALYSCLAAWWRNPVGRTLVAKTVLIALLFIPTTLSLFFSLNGLDSYIAGWIDMALIGLVTPVMLWRSAVWWRLHKAGRLPSNDQEDGGLLMLKRVTWRSWALPAALLAVFIVLGLAWHASGSAENWIYKVGTLGATSAPLLLAGIYTATGNKWWRNDLGTALVQSQLFVAVLAAPLCWAIWVDGGLISGGLLAWLEIAGPLLVTLGVLRLCWVFMRIHRDGGGKNGDEGDSDGAS